MDAKLYYTDHGSGEALVLLHGNGEDSTYFKHQIECFQKLFRVIALDSRGHGRSPRGAAPFTLEQFACDLAALLNDLEIQSAHILGFSDGANVAMLFAIAHPERVRSMVLNGGNLFFEGLTEQTRREIEAEYAAALEAGGPFQLERLRLMTDQPRIDPASLGRLRIPTLVVAGTDDMIEEAHTRLIADSIPGAILRFVEGTHFIAAENPDEFNAVVGAFLGAQRRPDS